MSLKAPAKAGAFVVCGQNDTQAASSGSDCIWDSFSMDGREEDHQWAGPYMLSRQVVAVNPDSGIRGMVEIGNHYPDDPKKQAECRKKIWDASTLLLCCFQLRGC